MERTPHLSEFEMNRAIGMLENGLRHAELAQYFGVSQSIVEPVC
jgi:hypothetical protein